MLNSNLREKQIFFVGHPFTLAGHNFNLVVTGGASKCKGQITLQDNLCAFSDLFVIFILDFVVISRMLSEKNSVICSLSKHFQKTNVSSLLLAEIE